MPAGPTVIDDAGHVGAPTWLVWRRLTDLERWPVWWDGMSVRTLSPSSPVAAAGADGPDGRVVLDVVIAGRDRRRWTLPGGRRRTRVVATPHGWRHDHSFHLTLVGDVVGDVEWWLEPTTTGTMVHHVAMVAPGLVATGPQRWRAAVRRGLWGLADALASEVRDAVGMPDDPTGTAQRSL